MSIRLPSILTVELTYRCNHQCLFCSCPWENDSSLRDTELSLEQWKRVFEKMRGYGVKQITFTGGEAILRPDFFQILDSAHSLGYSIGLISNGKNLDGEFLDKLMRYNLLLSISVPGIDTFAATTGNANVGHVLGLFEECKTRGIKTAANIAVTKANLPELYENIALPLINGASYVLLNRFLPGGRGLDNTKYLLSVEELNQMLDVAEEVLSKAGVYGHVGTELPYCAIKNPEKYKYLRMSTLCAGAKSFFVIDPSGYIKVCNHSPERLCKWTEVESLAENEYWNTFAFSEYLPKECVGCEHTDKCDGGCREAAHVYSGDVRGKDPILV